MGELREAVEEMREDAVLQCPIDNRPTEAYVTAKGALLKRRMTDACRTIPREERRPRLGARLGLARGPLPPHAMCPSPRLRGTSPGPNRGARPRRN